MAPKKPYLGAGFLTFLGINWVQGSILGPMMMFAPRLFFSINKQIGLLVGDSPELLDRLAEESHFGTRFLGAAIVTLETVLCYLIYTKPESRDLYLLNFFWMLTSGTGGLLFYWDTGMKCGLPLVAQSAFWGVGYWMLYQNPPVKNAPLAKAIHS
ncbi:unnamed protein product [Symbiodinium natans]|uniref:Uncharacterized protein n=1 Tax=Symbiodinium natans TaxID=878477 RepID=A0A812JMD4_9DINO|nr:unnamed protein product [Symbiodinium natans]